MLTSYNISLNMWLFTIRDGHIYMSTVKPGLSGQPWDIIWLCTRRNKNRNADSCKITIKLDQNQWNFVIRPHISPGMYMLNA